jgi:hypothetical protein
MKTIIKEPKYMGWSKKGFYSLAAFLLLSVLFLLGIIVSPEYAFGGAVIKGVGAALPGQVIAGEPGSTASVSKASPELLEDAVLKKVIQTHPSSFPLDTMISRATLQNTNSWEYEAFDTPYIPYYSAIKTGLSAATVFASAVVTPANVEFIRKGSTLFIKSIQGGDGKWLALLVTDVSRGASPTIQIMALNPVTAGYVPIIANNTPIIIGPIAADDLAMQVEQQVPTPQPYSNWNQLFMCQIEQGDYAEAHQKKVDWGWQDMHEYTIMDFRARRSIAYYLGYGGRFVDPVNNVVKYTTNGIYRQIVKKFLAPTAWADSDFIDFCQAVFVGNKGSQKKILFAGDQLIANISKTPMLKQQNAMSTEVVWGLEFTKIKTNFGVIYTHYDPLLTEMKLNGEGVVIDPEFLVRTNFNGVHYDKLDLKKAGVRRVQAESIAEASSALLRNLDSHVWVSTT